LELARAGHLFTKVATPKIYYRPYLLLPEQKTLIEQQIAQAQQQMETKEQDVTLQSRESDEENNANERAEDVRESSATPRGEDEEVVLEPEEQEGED